MSISASAQRGLGSAAHLAFGLSLLVGAVAIGVAIHDACAYDDENAAPSARATDFEPISYTSKNADVRLEVAGTYRGGFFNASACESIAYDPETQRLFVANNATKSVDVVNIGNPFVPTKEFSIDVSALISPIGPLNAVPTSVAVDHNGFLAVVVAPEEERTRRGKVAFFNTDLAENDGPINILPGWIYTDHGDLYTQRAGAFGSE